MTLEQAWDDFIQHRKEIKHPVTPLALTRLQDKLAILSLGNPNLAIAIINQSIEGGWQGLFALTAQNKDIYDAAQRRVVSSATEPCQYCQATILSRNRIHHEDNECKAAPKADPARAMEMVSELASKLRRN